MSKRALIEADLDKAREALKLLQDELPQYHSLLTDNQKEYVEAKASRAALSQIALAKGRVDTAQELLEQHQADIHTAKAEVQRLEAELDREVTLELMADRAKAAKKHRQAQDKALETAAQALAKAAETIRAERDANLGARREFAEAGEKLLPGFLKDRRQFDSIDRTKPAAMAALAAEAEERGAPLDYALDNANGQVGYLDETTKYPLPTGDFHAFVYAAVNLLDNQKRERELAEQRRIDGERQLAAERARWERMRGPETATLDVPESYGALATDHLGELVQSKAPINSQEQGVWPSFGITVLKKDLDEAEEILSRKLPECRYRVR
jgi:hypothetical protein